MNRGILFSVLLHLCVLLLGFFGLPLMYQSPAEDLMIIPIEIYQVAEENNIPQQKKSKPVVKKNAAKKPVAKPTSPKPPIAAKPKTKPVSIPFQIKPKPKKKPKPPVVDAFESVLKTVEALEHQEPGEKDAFEAIQTMLQEQPHDPEKHLTVNEKTMIQQQMYRCWDILGGAKDAQSLSVRIRVRFDIIGNVIEVDPVDQLRYNAEGNRFYRALADSAIRAVHKCSPLEHLPREKFQSWKEIEFNFDPSQLVY